MESVGLNEIREKFLSFYESKGHLRLPSFSLIPKSDKSILLINAGMTPMKPYFTGQETPPRNRVATCQKCIRTIDIDNVGDSSHCTFFEMLGNFSFGDYFKREAINWAWEFMTKVIKLSKDRLYITVYKEDDEAYNIWTNEIGIDVSHIYRMGKEDNFWEIGSGPCGPCSEIHYDRGEKYGCGKPDCGLGCDCGRFVEVWNLVFTQFDGDGEGNYTRLKKCNIDTGMGLERLACVVQDVDSVWDVDTIRKITEKISEISGCKYGVNAKTDVSLRIITDHIRSTTFMVSDGIIPSNEGRGYVLRRILRRAARHGRLLGINEENFLSVLCDTVIDVSKNAYPELYEKRDFIKKVVSQEEERFSQTIDQGLSILAEIISKTKNEGDKVLGGFDAFRLYDTFGFPLELTEEIARENGLEIDTEKFDELMKEQKDKARNAAKGFENTLWKGADAIAGIAPTDFLGYDCLTSSGSKILMILVNGIPASEISQGDEAVIITDKTPFYAESGGQVGDKG